MLSLVHSFDTISNGDYPEAGLLQGKDGAFYGTALQGGVVNCHGLGCGTVFRISADRSSFSVLHKFAGGTSDGGAPNASLVQGTDGAFYGTTTQGGASDNGVVFRLELQALIGRTTCGPAELRQCPTPSVKPRSTRS